MDAGKPPIEKACGEGLMPAGVDALKRLGVRIEPSHFTPFQGIRFINGYQNARANFPGAQGIGIRRTTLHALMVERAVEAGVTLLWNTPVRELDTKQARWIVGADGMNSRVRRWAGFGACASRVRRFGFRRHFAIAPWSDTVDVHWGRDCQIYVTPVGANETCLAVLSRHTGVRIDNAIKSFPEIAQRLRGLAATTAERGALSECRRLHKVYRGNVALIGDASGSVDAITGEGVALSFRQALALADALKSGDLASYNAAHRRLARMPALMARAMLLMDKRPRLRAAVIGLLASKPEMFSKLLSVHIGGTPAEADLPWFQFSNAD